MHNRRRAAPLCVSAIGGIPSCWAAGHYHSPPREHAYFIKPAGLPGKVGSLVERVEDKQHLCSLSSEGPLEPVNAIAPLEVAVPQARIERCGDQRLAWTA